MLFHFLNTREKNLQNNINLFFFFLFIWNVIKMNFLKSILNFLNLSQREIHTDNLSYFDLHEFQFTGFSWSCMECTNLHQNFFSFSLSLSNRYIPLSFIYLEFFLSYQCFTIHRIQGRQVQCRYSRIMLNYLISWQGYYIMHVRFFREGSRLYSQTKAMPLKHGEKTHNACNNCKNQQTFI